MIRIQVAAGRPVEALAYLERGRASLRSTPASIAASRLEVPRGPPNEVVVEYALAGDSLLAWTVRGSTITFAATGIDRESLARTIDRARTALERRAPDSVARRDLAQLHDWLIRPLEPAIGPPGTALVFIVDGDIAGIPFPALLDARHGRYLIEDHPLRFATSLRDAGRVTPSPTADAGSILLVSDPAFDNRSSPGLGRLAGAASEVREVGAHYARATVLDGGAATADAIEAAVGGVSVFHYAGHALFDAERPERSVLLTAAARDPPGLSAGRIAALNLRRVRLVVLSACETARPRASRSGGIGAFGGLAQAFLAAGATGVVGSDWRVDDRFTRPLMVALHAAYRTSGDGAAALRGAQLQLLRSDEIALRSPAAWAGFRYAGH
jgi:CHAT domain-containing protein